VPILNTVVRMTVSVITRPERLPFILIRDMRPRQSWHGATE
jgi:hypothetical protein